jgi:SWI/SNF-related matrix-associated actin-dependent regulator 1 of chromatin subfamily A
MQVDKVGNRWIARSTYEERAIPKQAGFRWDGALKHWYTQDAAVAERLLHPEIAAAKVELSRATDADVDIPCPAGLAYLPYQRAAIAYARGKRHVLFADEMGLGKTVEALAVINADPSIKTVLVICPASLRINWRRESDKWLVRRADIELVILNYDVLRKNREMLRAREWDIIILDECHYLKNPKAIRTAEVFGKWDKNPDKALAPIPAKRMVFLTGTPILNRPVEMWPLLKYAGVFKSWKYYVTRYCAGHQNGYGWDVSGSSNLPELQETLRRELMIRRLKKDVLTELPPKRRQVVELAPNGGQAAVDEENRAYAAYEDRLSELKAEVELSKASDNPADYEHAVSRLRDETRAAFTEISRLRHQTALAKAPQVVDFVRDQLETSDKIILFAHHLDVIDKYMTELAEFNPVKLTGEMNAEDRDASVQAFQNGAARIFIGSIHAAGVGLTLTAASHVIFAELDWVPGNVTQAEDRAHRIGQTDTVLVQHLVLDGSLDARMAQILIEKQEMIDQALDRKFEAEPAVPVKPHVTVSKQELEVPAFEPAILEAALRAMQILASFDADHAFYENNLGFNKTDSRIGHSLAERSQLTNKQCVIAVKLARKYRRQLPADLTSTINVSANPAQGEQQ